MQWQAVIFDLDDTLYPEQEYVLSGFRHVARYMQDKTGISMEWGYAQLEVLYRQGIRGNTFNLWLDQVGLPSERWLAQLVEEYRSHTPCIEPFAETTALLMALRPHCKVALLSDGYLEVQQRKLAALAIAPYFDTIAFSDHWGRAAWKPSPVAFLHVLSRVNVPAEMAVYVGDNPQKDFLGARRAGMQSIWWRREGGEYSHTAPPTVEHEPDYTVTYPDALKSLLLSSHQ